MSIELCMNENQEKVRVLIEKFINDNPKVIYETSIQNCQAHYPLNNMIEEYLDNNGLSNYRVYGVFNERTGHFSTTNMEIRDQDDNLTGIYLKYSKRKLEDLSTYRDDDYFGKVKVGKFKLQFKIKMYQECLVLS